MIRKALPRFAITGQFKLLPYLAAFPSYEPFSAFRTRFAQFTVVFKSDCSRHEGAGDAVSGMFVGPLVLDKRVKVHDPSLSISREIPSEAVASGKIDCFSPKTSDRK